MKKRFTEEQIIGFLREAEAGLPIAELCRKHAFSEASYYLWRSKFGGMSVSDAKRLKQLPSGCRAGDNAKAFVGGFRLWNDADDASRTAPREARSGLRRSKRRGPPRITAAEPETEAADKSAPAAVVPESHS